jgi:hypothetical protein
MSADDRTKMWRLKEANKSEVEIAKTLNFTESYIANAIAKGKDYQPATKATGATSNGNSSTLAYSKGGLERLYRDQGTKGLTKLIQRATEVINEQKEAEVETHISALLERGLPKQQAEAIRKTLAGAK